MTAGGLWLPVTMDDDPPQRSPRMPMLTHITLTTGRGCNSPRSAIADAALDELVPWLEQALQSETSAVIDGEDYCLTCAAAGDAVHATVWKDSDPLATMVVAATEEASEAAWTTAIRMDEPAFRAATRTDDFGQADRPPAPWCAVVYWWPVETLDRLERWLDEFHRRLAWTWIERLAPSASR